MAGKRKLTDIAVYLLFGMICLMLLWRPWEPDEASLGFKSADEEMRALLRQQQESMESAAMPPSEPKEKAAKPPSVTKAAETKPLTGAKEAAKKDDTARSEDSAVNAETKETVSANAKINLNQATAQQLDALPGIGASRAQAIVALRQKLGGRFQSVEQLLEVKGIGDKMLENLKPLVTLEP